MSGEISHHIEYPLETSKEMHKSRFAEEKKISVLSSIVFLYIGNCLSDAFKSSFL